MRWCPWRGYRNLADSKAYRVPLLPSVPLNSKAYFPRCPTDFSGLRRSWESNHGRGRESNHGHWRWLVASARRDATREHACRSVRPDARGVGRKMGRRDVLLAPHVSEAATRRA
jgi:hypothetical protein